MNEKDLFERFAGGRIEESSPKPKRNQVVDLAEIDALRTLLWTRTVIQSAGCAPSAILDKYNFKLSRLEFPLYAKAQRLPSIETLVDVEEACPIGRSASMARPFVGTRALFEVGVDGLPLWEVLEGSTGVCEAVLDAWAGDSASDFQRKLWWLIAALLPDEEVTQVRELAELPTGDRFSYETSMLMALSKSMNMDSPHMQRLKLTPTARSVITVLAAWQLSYERRTMRSEMDYLLIPMVSALHINFPLIHEEFGQWIVNRAGKFIKARFPLK